MSAIRHVAAVATAVFATMFAHGSYLYWQVGTNSDADYSLATLYYGSYGSWSTLDAEGWSGVAEKGAETVGPYQVNLSTLGEDVESYSFYVELAQYTLSGEGYVENVATSWRWGYSDLVEQGYILTEGLSIPTITPMAVNFSQPAPEPTSGALTILGMSLLALRRRRSCG